MDRSARRHVVIAIMLMCMAGVGGLMSGCVNVDGGAVEVGWDLRFPDGRRTDEDGNSVSCTRAGLGKMALSLEAVSTGEKPCAGRAQCRFPCSSQGVGTTDFVIKPDDYAMELRVLDGADRELGPGDGILTPSVVVRRVVLGEITSLSVYLIVVDAR